MKKYIPLAIIYLLFLIILAANDAGLFYLYKENSNQQLQTYNDKISALQKQISGLQGNLESVSTQAANASKAVALSSQEIKNRQQVEQNSQTQSVTASVSKAVPAVVSVVISKNIPQYTVQYQNPFGDDPFFQDFGIKIPVYVPSGKTQLQQVGVGTGFIITSNGYILTNRHVVYDTSASYTVLLANGKQETANVVYRDSNNDVAVIKISGSNYPIVNFGDSNSIQLGQTVVAIGNALGQYNNSVSVGVISGLNRTVKASDNAGSVETLNGVIQTDVAINPGNSGGPLLDLNGNVVGINVAMASGANNIGFSIPINTVKNIIKSIGIQ